MGHGGRREGAGRKPKAKEQDLIEKLTPYEEDAIQALGEAVRDRKPWAIRLYMAYRYGKPKETQDLNVFTEQPLFNLD